MALTAKETALYEALVRIKNDPAMQPVVEWLKEMRETARDRMETCGENHQTEQGKAQALKKVINDIERAPEFLGRA